MIRGRGRERRERKREKGEEERKRGRQERKRREKGGGRVNIYLTASSGLPPQRTALKQP